MQVTTDGKRKVIDRIDASGAGDVDMSKFVEPDENGKIKGIQYFSKFNTLRLFPMDALLGATGRELTLPAEVADKGFKFRVGSKRVFPLFPRSLKERMIKERQEKIWDPQHKPKVAETHRKLQEFEAEAGDLSSLSGMSKLEHQNHEVELVRKTLTRMVLKTSGPKRLH